MIDGADKPTRLISRRVLLKLAGTSACAAYLRSLTGYENLWEQQPVIAVDRWGKGVCRFCGTGCGIMIGLKGNKVVDVKGDEKAHNRGRLCIKRLATRDIFLFSQPPPLSDDPKKRQS